MLFETLGQARVFLYMAAAGAVIAMLYDVLCLARGAFGRQGAWISEVLFALAAAALLFLAMVRVEMPGLRAYVLLGGAVGWFLYAASLSRLMHWLGGRLSGLRRKKARDPG